MPDDVAAWDGMALAPERERGAPEAQTDYAGGGRALRHIPPQALRCAPLWLRAVRRLLCEHQRRAALASTALIAPTLVFASALFEAHSARARVPRDSPRTAHMRGRCDHALFAPSRCPPPTLRLRLPSARASSAACRGSVGPGCGTVSHCGAAGGQPGKLARPRVGHAASVALPPHCPAMQCGAD